MGPTSNNGVFTETRARDKIGTVIVIASCGLAGAASLYIAWPEIRIPLVLGLLVVVGLFFAVTRLFLFLLLFVIYMFFEGIFKNVFTLPIMFFLRDIFITIISLAWLVRYPLNRGFRGRYDKPIVVAIFAFVFYTLVLTVTPFTTESILFRLGGARWWLANFPLFFIGMDVINTKEKFDRFCYAFLVVAFPTAVYGIIQYYIGFEHLLAVSPHYDKLIKWVYFHGSTSDVALRRRVFSTFTLPSYFAAALHAACLLAVAYLKQVKAYQYKMVLAVAFILFVVALAFTGSRSAGYSTLISGLIIICAFERRRGWVVFISVGLAAAFVAVIVISQGVYFYRLGLIITDFDYTIGRITLPLKVAIADVEGHPLGYGVSTSAKVGRALGDVGATSPFRFVENAFGQVLVSLGWPGLCLFSVLLIITPLRLVKSLRTKSREISWRTVLVLGYCVSVSLTMLTSMAFYDGLRPIMYWLLAGSVLAIHKSEGGYENRLRM